MIEIRKLIPDVYNQSRDFSVFVGILQIMLNELDVKSKVLESLPVESILPYKLSNYPKIMPKFRNLIKNKGTNLSILEAVGLCGGIIPLFEDEEKYLAEFNLFSGDIDYLDRDNPDLLKEYSINPNSLVYYGLHGDNDGTYLMHINVKNPGDIDQGLLNKLLYYIKPVNTVVILENYQNPSLK